MEHRVGNYRHFREAYCLHFQGAELSRCGWRQYFPPNKTPLRCNPEDQHLVPRDSSMRNKVQLCTFGAVPMQKGGRCNLACSGLLH